MRCDEYEILISAYADGELDGQEKADVEAHIKGCEGCRRLYKETLGLQCDLADALTRCGDVPDLVSAVTAQIRQRPRFGFGWARAAAAAAVVIVFSYALLHSPTGEKPAREATVFPPSQATRQHGKPVTPQDKPRVVVKENHSRPVPHSAPYVFAKKSKTSLPQPPPEPDQIAENKQEAPNIAADAAEVVVEYTDGINAAGRAADLVIAPKIPVAGPGQRVVAETEIVTENGTPTQRMCYRIIDITPDDTPEEPDGGE